MSRLTRAERQQVTRRRLDALTEHELPDALARPPGERGGALARWLLADQPPVEILLAVELARLRTEDAEVAATLDRVLETTVGMVDRALELGTSGVGALSHEERRARVLALVAGGLGANLLRQLGAQVPERALELTLRGIVEPDRPGDAS